MCDINNIEFKCVKHQKDFLYFKDSNYYCSECLKENDFEDYLILDTITLSKKEIDDFKKIIKDSENILKEINIMNEKYIKKVKESNELFNKRNKTLIEYCKNLIKFNEKYDRNYNLISTIRRISKNINNINELKYNKLIDFYDNENIIKFNNELKYGNFMNEKSYFESENIIKKGEYYLGECINKGTFGEVFKALSIKDKKIVSIKKLINADEEEFINEINILKQMNNCENSIKYLDSFKEKNNKFIVTELCDGSLRKLINERKYGFSIEEIKKIFCQINEGLKYLNSKNLL
jgi:sulfur relay (sulfurtransferase) DsrC/TusE family protein